MTRERPVASPCVQICALDEADLCIGCQRSVDELTRWSRMDNVERRQVLARCIERTHVSGLFLQVPSAPQA